MKIGRNQLCPCGSGRKYKKCCGAITRPPAPALEERAEHIRRLLDRNLAEERIRTRQQGLGRPIVSAKIGDYQFVGVGSTVHMVKDCQTFVDFLDRYIKVKLGAEWGQAEEAKPLGERHPLLQLHQAYADFRAASSAADGALSSAETTGAAAAFICLAYGLYLLDHNVELQERLIKRLRDRSNFQGAYYEVAVARMLIRAGFKLELEDETDPAVKHCEFSATSRSGKKYWVEAKMRAIAGVLGKSQMDGGSDKRPIQKLIPHLNQALAKPAKDERLIFIDLNTAEGLETPTAPSWRDAAGRRLEEYEFKELKAGERAYLFVTNFAYHIDLDSPPRGSMFPYGLGYDFGKPIRETLSQRYRREDRHRDAMAIMNAFQEDLAIPTTFDGSLPSETFGRSQRVLIGETYAFGGEDGKPPTIGTVESATVNEFKNEALIAIRIPDGGRKILVQPMTVDEMHDYDKHRDAYFGRISKSGRSTNDPYELFKWLLDNYKNTKREVILGFLKDNPKFSEWEALSDDDLPLAYCEALVRSAVAKSEPPPAI